MKGVILAGGNGTRLYPLTAVMNKHMLPVGKYPMVMHGVARMKEAGIKDILIVVGKNHAGGFLNLLGSGDQLGVNLSYRVQESSGGIADALRLAEDFTGNENIMVLLGDNIFTESLANAVQTFEGNRYGAQVFIKAVSDPQRFGVPILMNNRIQAIEEKPLNPLSKYAVTGIYMYSPSVYSIIKTIQPSDRGELEITDVNNIYISLSQLGFEELRGEWIDAGTHESLAKANKMTEHIHLEKIFHHPIENTNSMMLK
ncbi:sugar phosphate nucleotidyltransferase [Alkalicoccobacillus porphyridii]|uniref:Glucose-1-phosphate thymidylyltransferase n=1 Tax=Alkalicoccobacillus porphyridii TaxID=2597270 RepID=A0A554A475_9BACI|nr:sugar phosphate nucleotidyltransferase [Alkalicoccobacillus porphyridii]TSB48481.1 spore coat protein [Alkalicoccobacillus porphyridii]